MNLSVIKGNVIRGGNRALLLVKKASPEILTAVGVGCIVGGTVMACKATLSCEDIIAQHEHGMEMIHRAEEISAEDPEEIYTDKMKKQDMVIQYVHTAKEFVKLYGPAVLVGTTGIACILGGHHILKKRNVALMAAYKALDETFRNYRQRVVEDYGEETDKMYRSGMRKEIIEVQDPDNPKKKKKEEVLTSTDGHSMYAKFFDQMSMHWSKNPEYNLLFLKNQQKTANMMLKIRGHVFLNEVYDLLDIPRTKAGAVVGWIDRGGEDQIDFGIYDLFDPEKRDFLNGYNDAIMLDFNVDGVVFDQI